MRGSIDLALGAGATSTEVTDIPIAHEELLVSLPVSHPLAGQERISLKDLRDTPFVLQGRQHSIRLLADQLFLEAGFEPVVAFESSDVILLDSMMHQAVGAGLVSKAHVFPCPELSYRPLEPPVYQTLHLRYPLGHTLTEPERYLAGLLASERLADPRYQATDDPLVQSLLQNAASPTAEDTGPAQEKAASGTQAMQEVNLDSKVMEYLISIVEEQSLSKAADKHFLTQSALSRHLHSVEEMVGTPLFSREHNRLRPTSAGAVFVNNARNILRIEKEMFEHTRSYQKGHSRSLYISCDHLFAQVLREQTVPQFRAIHPDIELIITEENQEGTLEALMNASADIGVFLSISREHPLLHCDVISMTEIVYCFASDACPPGWAPGSPLPEGFFPRPQLMAPRAPPSTPNRPSCSTGWPERAASPRLRPARPRPPSCPSTSSSAATTTTAPPSSRPARSTSCWATIWAALSPARRWSSSHLSRKRCRMCSPSRRRDEETSIWKQVFAHPITN